MNNEFDLKKYSGVQLKNKRIEKGLTQADLARLLTEFKKGQDDDSVVTRQTISKYENGERGMNLEMISDLSRILEVPVSYFFPSPNYLENTIEVQTTTLFSKTILDDEGFSLEIKTNIPFDDLSLDEQKEIMDSAMEELLALKKEIRQTQSS